MDLVHLLRTSSQSTLFIHLQQVVEVEVVVEVVKTQLQKMIVQMVIVLEVIQMDYVLLK
jgi:hypothetical protein